MSDEELIAAISDHPDRAVTAEEVAEQLDFTKQGILKRLNSLSDAGEIVKKKVGARAVVWWVPEDQDERDT